MYSYFKLENVAKLYLAIIIIKYRLYSHSLQSKHRKAAGNNLRKILLQFFVNQKILVFTDFLCYENLALYSITHFPLINFQRYVCLKLQVCNRNGLQAGLHNHFK